MLLPDQIDFNGPFPKLSRRLRLGVVGRRACVGNASDGRAP